MNRIRLERVDAVILKRHDYGEADRILTLYTPTRGKVSCIAKGVRRLTSRSGGHIELFTHASLLLARGRNLDVLNQAETLDSFGGLRRDLLRATYAYHAAELIDRLTGEGQRNSALYARFLETLSALSDHPSPGLALRWFELQLLGLLGYRPQLSHCVECSDELGPAGNGYAAEQGGVLCPDCAPGAARVTDLDETSFKVMRFLQVNPWSVARRLDMSPETGRTLESALVASLMCALERDLKSIEFLNNLRRVASTHPDPTTP